MNTQKNVVVHYGSGEKTAEQIILSSFDVFLKKELQHIAKAPPHVVQCDR